MPRAIPAIVLCALLLGSACARETITSTASRPETAKGPQTYRVGVDGPSSAEDNFAFGAYFPTAFKVRPGDTVSFTNLSSHDGHTVTLGVSADRTNSPPPETRAGQANPTVFRPCFTQTPPSTDLEACPVAPPSPGGAAPAYSGRGYWNSGYILPALLGGGTAGSAQVRLTPDIPPGRYAVVCLVHPFMNGELEVVANDADRLSPAQARAAGEREFKKAQAEARGLQKPVREVSGATAITAGWGDNLVAVNRFNPSTASVKVGDTVTWTGESPYMPHTISFESPFGTPEDPNAFLPAGAKSGSSYQGGVAHSGLIGPAPAFATNSFSLTFIKAGMYRYVCILHPRMTGDVEVKA